MTRDTHAKFLPKALALNSMAPRRAPARRSARFDSPATASASGAGTGLDTPGLGGAATPATLNLSTPGTTPSLEDSVVKPSKGKGRAKRALPSDSELSDIEEPTPSAGRGESATGGNSDALT